MNEEMSNTSTNRKLSGSPVLSKVFLAVLGLHIVVIVCFGAYQLLKGNSDSKVAAETAVTEKNEATPTDAASGTPVTDQAQQPTVETDHTQSAAPVADSHPAEANQSMSMPATNDPIWSAHDGSSSTSGSPAAVKPVVDTPVKTEVASTAVSGSYTVQKGDSLYKIAHKNHLTVAALKEQNKLTTDNLKIGQVLVLPEGKTAAAVQATTEKPVVEAEHAARAATAQASAGLKSYQVRQGDTLWKIARSFNSKPAEIAKLNGIQDPSKLKVGMTIKVPTVAPAGRETASPAQGALQKTDVAMIRDKTE